ncbi:hypothetical protein F5887DRAFT_1281805 [Amanita rubescens]|nr:hypothetical protein F5887DRAFT_1281805 [Amanita rubescens]
MANFADIKITPALTSVSPIQDVENDLVPSFTTLLSADPSSLSYGLYAIRKTAHTLLAFVRVSTPEAIRPFAYNKEFMLALATMYGDGLAAIATGYGGISVLRTTIVAEEGSTAREPDDWGVLSLGLVCRRALVKTRRGSRVTNASFTRLLSPQE